MSSDLPGAIKNHLLLCDANQGDETLFGLLLNYYQIIRASQPRSDKKSEQRVAGDA